MQISNNLVIRHTNMVYLGNGILFGNEKESTDTGTSMDEPQKHQTKWMKPDSGDYMIPLMCNVQKR